MSEPDQKTCRTCANATTKPGNEAMYKHGFRNCQHKPVWYFVVGNGRCEKWQQK